MPASARVGGRSSGIGFSENPILGRPARAIPTVAFCAAIISPRRRSARMRFSGRRGTIGASSTGPQAQPTQSQEYRVFQKLAAVLEWGTTIFGHSLGDPLSPYRPKDPRAGGGERSADRPLAQTYYVRRLSGTARHRRGDLAGRRAP